MGAGAQFFGQTVALLEALRATQMEKFYEAYRRSLAHLYSY